MRRGLGGPVNKNKAMNDDVKLESCISVLVFSQTISGIPT